MNSYTEKKLRVTIRLADDSSTVFTSTGDSTLVIDELRMSASVSANARQATQMELSIWGMREADMNALTVAWTDPSAIRDNIVTLEADSGDGYRPVFTGTIIEAQPDFRRAPDVSFQILAIISYFQQINVSPPLSYKGAVSIDVICKNLADQLKLSYTGVGVSGKVIHNPYYPGTVFDQLRDACRDAGVDFYFQVGRLIVTPVLQPLSNVPAVILSPTSGLLGYPMFSRQGLIVSAIYDAAFQCASALEIQDSQVKGANGSWYPYSMEINLSANLPNGPWNVSLQCNKAGL